MPTKLQNQAKLNSEKHKFRQRMIPISNSFVGRNKAPSLRAFAPLGIMACSILGALNVSALSISVPQTISLDLIPGKSTNSGTATVEIVAGDALGGYTLTLSDPSNTGTLTGTNGNEMTINPVPENTTWTTETSFPDNANTWGLKYCNKTENTTCLNNATYKAPTNTPLEIDKTYTKNTTTTEYAVVLGAKLNAEITKDTYSSTFTLAASANPVDVNISYIDLSNNIPAPYSNTIDLNATSSITLSGQVPTKSGYIFRGWCSKPTTTTTCPEDGTTYQPNGTYSLTSGATANLYAMWEKSTITLEQAFADAEKPKYNGYYKLQDMETTICDSVNTIGEEGTITLIDSRDEKTYDVTKLQDGKCWMLDNLALGSDTDIIALTPENSNIASNFDLPASTSSGFANNESGRTVARINAQYKDNYSTETTKNPVDGSDFANDAGGQESWKFGVYYNYCATSAGAVCEDFYPSTANAQYDICPKGWRLPTGGDGGESQALYSALGDPNNTVANGGSAEAYSDLRNLLHLPLSGYFSYGSAHDRGTAGRFWSSTHEGTTAMYILRVDATKVHLTRDDFLYGFSIRCLAK